MTLAQKNIYLQSLFGYNSIKNATNKQIIYTKVNYYSTNKASRRFLAREFPIPENCDFLSARSLAGTQTSK